MKTIQYMPIGIIHSPFKTTGEMPLQTKFSDGAMGIMESLHDYEEGPHDLEKFSQIIPVYHFHLSRALELNVKPSHGNSSHGIFSIRFPNRPNPIGLSVDHLDGIDRRTLNASNIDILDGTP